MSMCDASLLSEGAHVSDQGLDLFGRELVLEGGHLALLDAVRDGVDDLLVGGVLLELRPGEVLGLQLPTFLRLALAVGAMADRATLLVDLLGSASSGHRSRRRSGGLGQKREREADHVASSMRRSARSTSSRSASRACRGAAISASPASESASCTA